MPHKKPKNIAEYTTVLKSGFVNASFNTIAKSGTTMNAQVTGIIIIAIVTWMSHQDSHFKGSIYFIPRPKEP
jgi:hypothetical protein